MEIRVDQAAFGVGQASISGDWQFLNDRFCEIVGHARQELLASSERDITHPDDRAASDEVIRRLLVGEISSSSLEKRYVQSDGSVVWARLFVSLVRGHDNLPQSFILVIEDFAERIQAERALKENEQRLQLALSAAGLGFWERNLRTGVTVISGEFARLHGLTPDHPSLTHEEYLELVHPDDRNRMNEQYRQSLEETHFWDTEFRVVWPDRSVHWILAKGQVLPDNLGRPVRLAGIVMDVTERKRVEEQRSRLASIVQSCEDAIFSKDLDGGILSWNAGAEKLFGYTADEIIGKSISLLLPPEHLPELPNILGRIRSGARLEHYEVTRMRKDGSRVDISVTISPIKDSAGVLVGNCGIARDITDRKQAEAALKESQQRYKEVFDFTSECIFLIDVTSDGRFKFASFNPAEEKAVGFSSAEVSGRFVEEVLGEQVANTVLPHYRHCLELGTVISYEVELALPIGRRHFHTNLIPLRNPTGRIYRMVGMARDVTGYKQTEEALRISQQRLELAQEAGGIATWDWDIVANQKHCSKEYWRLYGLPERDVAPMPEEWLQSVHPEDRARVREERNRALDGTGHYNTEFRVVWPNGTIHWLLGKGEVFRDSNGKPIRMLGVNMDINERKYADQALRESEERFRNMADTAPVMIWVAGTDKVLTFFNKTWLNFVGRTLEQEIDNGWVQSVHPDDVERCFASYCASFDAREPFHIEYRLRRADGEYRWVLCSGVPRFASGGVFAGYIGSDIDITDVKRAEQELVLNQALRESEEKYHSIVETMTEGVWILDHDDRTTFVNQQMAAMLGYSVEQVLGRHLLDFKDEEARPIALQRLERRRQGITEQYDSTFQTSDGRRLTVLISTRPLWDSDGCYAGTLGIITDITERSLLEERLHQANKMEAIGRLAGGVAHDFNNLLTVINGYSDLLLRNSNVGDRTHVQLSEIRSAGQRAQELTNQILSFSRNQMRATDTLNLRSVIEDAEEMLRRMIGEDIELVTIFDPCLGNVRADRTEVIQVLLNLAVNARDAMPTGGTLTFALANVEVDEKDVRTYPGTRPGAHVLLTVTDTGFGMDAQIQKHLFEPFFTTKKVGKGTGLGLATVYGIVSQSDGWIQVDSKPRQGTTFRIYWPRVTGVPPKEKGHVELSDQLLFGTETVLVVEDQPQVRQMTCSILRQFGYQILEASCGEEALCLAETHTGPLHLLLTDVIMPGMNGIELAARLSLRPTPVLFMSGYSNRTEAVHDSGVTYIQKPFTPDTLVRTVREVLDGADHTTPPQDMVRRFFDFRRSASS
jgi:two-component system cell cycle sensor histidine kinase/response regulator CckA